MAETGWSVDPRTRQWQEQVGVEATADDVDRAVRAAEATIPALADRAARTALLRAAAQLLEKEAPRVVATADAETALGTAQLQRELGRVRPISRPDGAPVVVHCMSGRGYPDDEEWERRAVPACE